MKNKKIRFWSAGFTHKMTSFFITLGFIFSLSASVSFAEQGTINCDPAEIAKMDDKMKKRSEKICSRKIKTNKDDKARLEKKKAWYNANVKGHSAMEDVVKANNGYHPADVEDLGDEVIWKYRSKSNQALLAECKEYVFTGKGAKLKNRRVYACE